MFRTLIAYSWMCCVKRVLLLLKGKSIWDTQVTAENHKPAYVQFDKDVFCVKNEFLRRKIPVHHTLNIFSCEQLMRFRWNLSCPAVRQGGHQLWQQTLHWRHCTVNKETRGVIYKKKKKRLKFRDTHNQASSDFPQWAVNYCLNLAVQALAITSAELRLRQTWPI